MKLGMQVGLGPGHIVLDRDPALPPPKGHSLPQFSAHICCHQMVRWIKVPFGREVGLSPSNIVLDGDPALPPPYGHRPPIFGPCLLWPIGWMDQDGTWHEGGPRSRSHCTGFGPSSPPPKKGSQPPIFGPCQLWPNGWMHQDNAWYGGTPQPRQHCVRWEPSSPFPKGAQLCQFSAHACCGQTAGWTEMPLGMEVGLGPGNFLLDADPVRLPPIKVAQPPPNFRPMSIVAKQLHR